MSEIFHWYSALSNIVSISQQYLLLDGLTLQIDEYVGFVLRWVSVSYHAGETWPVGMTSPQLNFALAGLIKNNVSINISFKFVSIVLMK